MTNRKKILEDAKIVKSKTMKDKFIFYKDSYNLDMKKHFEELGIVIEYINEGFSYFTKDTSDDLTIFINIKETDKNYDWKLTHLFAHYILHSDTEGTNIKFVDSIFDKNFKIWWEEEANLFAMEYILNDYKIREYMKKPVKDGYLDTLDLTNTFNAPLDFILLKIQLLGYVI